MNEGLTASQSRFHEVPLVLFSAVSVIGCGVGAAHLVLSVAGITPFRPPPTAPNLILVLLATGLIVSLAHLGRPQGMFDIFRGVWRSRLSTEVVVVGIAFGGAVLSALLPTDHVLFGPAWLLTALACFASLLMLGAVYSLPGRPGWGRVVALQPLTTGLVVGWVLWAASVPRAWPGVLFSGLMAVFIVLDLGVTLARMVIIAAARKRATPDHERFFRLRNVLLPIRALLIDLLPLQLIILGYWRVAIFSLVLGVFLDRTVFYGLALKETTEGEVARIETVLAGG